MPREHQQYLPLPLALYHNKLLVINSNEYLRHRLNGIHTRLHMCVYKMHTFSNPGIVQFVYDFGVSDVKLDIERQQTSRAEVANCGRPSISQ